MHIVVYRIEGDDFLRIFEEAPTVKTLSLEYTLLDRRRNKKLNDLWSFLSIKDSSMNVLLPELTELYYYNYEYLNRDMIKEATTLFSEALLSRKRYSKNFRFYGHFGDSSCCTKNLLCSMADGPYDSSYIKKLFEIS